MSNGESSDVQTELSRTAVAKEAARITASWLGSKAQTLGYLSGVLFLAVAVALPAAYLLASIAIPGATWAFGQAVAAVPSIVWTALYWVATIAGWLFVALLVVSALVELRDRARENIEERDGR